MITRHHTHPSAQCECETCEIEHNCEAETHLEFAVNPHNGSMIALYPANEGWWVVVVNHCTETGRTMSGWRGYSRFADACDLFWETAEHHPR